MGVRELLAGLRRRRPARLPAPIVGAALGAGGLLLLSIAGSSAPRPPAPAPVQHWASASPLDRQVTRYANDVDAFWRSTYPALFGSPFTPLAQGVVAAEKDRWLPSCGAFDPSYVDVENNAFYCAGGDMVVFDRDGFFPALVREYGNVALGVVLAHEWAHAVQDRSSSTATGVVEEQQADCYAGAWLASSPLVASASDDEVLGAASAVLAFRDAADSDGADAHGTAFDRLGALADGFLVGASRCVEYDRAAPATFDLPGDAGKPRPLDGLLELVESELHGAVRGGPAQLDTSASCAPVKRVATLCDNARAVGVDLASAASVAGSVGDFAVVAAVAYEWHRGALVGAGWPATRSTASAAMCRTGAWVRGLVDDPDGALVVREGDLDEIAAMLVASAASSEGSLGVALTAVDAFRDGFAGGVGECVR